VGAKKNKEVTTDLVTALTISFTTLKKKREMEEENSATLTIAFRDSQLRTSVNTQKTLCSIFRT
jgi:hypothetical protein